MKIIVAVIVYNRYQNIERWIRCWRASTILPGTELIIIQNDPGDRIIKELCRSEEISYISRPNIGYDIGAFQDVCRGRLQGFPQDYDFLLWCTDDCIPMTKDFIAPFVDNWDNTVGATCMKISRSVSPHIRTTGFMISRYVAGQLQFPADPILTKTQCYHFEHRGGMQTMTNQIRTMGLSVKQVAPDRSSPLWDMGYWKRLDREGEHERIFPSGKVRGDKVTFICTIFNTYPQIISSLILQTHQNWELLLIHDGPTDNHGIRIQASQDPRVKFIETPERVGNWGHSLRQRALRGEIHPWEGDYVVITNADNYYTPVFVEYMLKGFKTHTSVASYCDKMIHSYKAWDLIPVKLERGYLDCGGVMVKGDIAREVGWRDTESHSSDFTYFSDIASRYSWSNFQRVKGCLFVHN